MIFGCYLFSMCRWLSLQCMQTFLCLLVLEFNSASIKFILCDLTTMTVEIKKKKNYCFIGDSNCMNLATRQFPLLVQIYMITVSPTKFQRKRTLMIVGSSVLVGRLEVAGSSLPTPAGGTFHGCQVVVPPFATQSNWWAFEFCHILNCILIRWGSILSHHVYQNNKKNNGLGCFVKGPRCPIHLVFRTKLKLTIGTPRLTISDKFRVSLATISTRKIDQFS